MVLRVGAGKISPLRHHIKGLTNKSNRVRRRWKSTGVAEEASLAGIELGISSAPTRAQLLRLCAVTSIPFIGFGFADNFIMIIAGDAIDQTLGVWLGISTMAAAGLGNMLSDVVGLGAGDIIEAWCFKLGFREPPLTAMQRASKIVRRTKAVSSVLGMSLGCIIGMVPLLFMTDRKKMYFNEKELLLYETFFQPFGVSPPDFFDLMHHGNWRTAEPGGVIVPAGDIMDRVILVHKGAAAAYVQETPERVGAKLYTYRGREQQLPELVPTSGEVATTSGVTRRNTGSTRIASREDDEEASAGRRETVRGSIIGGSALVDVSVLNVPYPNTVKATTRCEFVEWKIQELSEQMQHNKAVEAAMFSTLYLDLVEGLRRQTSDNAHADMALPPDQTAGGSNGSGGGAGGGLADERLAASLNEFSILMRAVLTDGRVHASERQLVREFMASKGISQRDHHRTLELNGWTTQEWELGRKKDLDAKFEQEVQERIKEIPGMMKKAGIRSRVVGGGGSNQQQSPPPGGQGSELSK